MGDGAASDMFATISIGAHVEEDKKSKAFKEARSYFESRQFYISAQEFSGGHGWRLELFARAMPTSNHKKLQSESIKRALHAILKRFVDKNTPFSSVVIHKCSSEQSLALEQRLSQDRSDSILDETRDASESVNLAESVPPVMVQCTTAVKCPLSTVLQDQRAEPQYTDDMCQAASPTANWSHMRRQRRHGGGLQYLHRRVVAGGWGCGG